EMEERLKHLIRCGLAGLEAFYSAFSENEKQCALDLAGKYRLLVTAGSDYHGGNKSAGFGETGLDESERLPEGLIRFLTLCEEAGRTTIK
ncbi:MAG: hypothetical protein II797_01855, partial [Clostridia bacterium]|nr:hypothetical protein [Clostridia bacterium]